MAYFNPYGMQYGNVSPYNYPQGAQTQQYVYASVNGYEGAKNYPLGMNQSMLLMDSNQPIAYKKTSNGLGQCSIECYKLVPITEQEVLGKVQEEKQPEYVLKSDFDALCKRIDDLFKTPKEDKEE